MICSKCRAANRSYAMFCLECGEPLAAFRVAQSDVAAADDVAQPGAAKDPKETPLIRVAGRSLTRRQVELAAGVVLLALVLLFGVADALRQQRQDAAYRAGLLAESERHWDVAAGAFARAEDHRDAAERQESAALKVRQRDSLYDAALKAELLSDWSRARVLFGLVRDIQPDYRAVATQFAEAQEGEIRAWVAGLFYQRVGGERPGIYRTATYGDADYYLEGSDGTSAMLMLGRDGESAIYRGSGSALYLAQFSALAGVAPRIQLLPATLDRSGWGTPGKSGFWWSGAITDDVHFVDYETLRLTAVTSATGAKVLNYDPNGDRVLLGLAPDSAATGTRLALASAPDWTPKVVVSGALRVSAAQISPDGQWLLYQQEQDGALDAYSNPMSLRGGFDLLWSKDPGAARTVSLMLVRLDGSAAGGGVSLGREERNRMLDFLVLPNGEHDADRISARFAPSTETTYVVADRIEAGSRRLTVYNAASGLQQTLLPNLPPDDNGYSTRFSPPGDTMLVQQQSATGVRVQVQALGGREPQRDLIVATAADQRLIPWISAHEDYLLYAVVEDGRNGSRQRYSIYSLDLDGKTLAQPQALLSESYTPLTVRPAIALAMAPSGQMLSYVDPAGNLVALSLDGATRVVLAADVSRVWGPQ